MSTSPREKGQRSFYWFLVLCISACVLTLTSCGGGESTPGSPAVSVLVRPSTIDFGSVTPNSAVTRFVTITNVTWQKVTLESVDASPGDIFAIQGWTGPLGLGPAQQLQLRVRFAPRSSGMSQGTITFSLRVQPTANGGISTIMQTPPTLNVVSWSPSGAVHGHELASIHVYGNGASANQSHRISVGITPSYASVQPSGSVQFASKVTGTSNQAVTWSAVLGSVTASGFYTAPALANSAVDTVTAISAADPTQSSSASIAINSTPASGPVSVAISPKSATVSSGGSIQFTSSISGTSNQSITWSAVLGSVSSSGLYTAPKVSSSAADTITAISAADPTKYASAPVSIEASQIWTAANQQPVTMQFYPNSIFTTPLPADVGNHLLNNSDAIVSNIQHGSDCPMATNCNTAGVLSVIDTTPGGDTAAAKNDFYYSSDSDPVYKVVSCGPAPSQPANNPNGKYFHLWNRAQFSSNNNDTWLIDWDQSSDLDPTPGGRIVSFYYFNTGVQPRQLPACSCHSKACADATASCQIANYYYCDMGYPFQDSKAYDEGTSYSSAHYAAGVGNLRANEIIAGRVNHALILDFYCDNPGPSFPATGDVMDCALIDRSRDLAPHNGALLWIDTGYQCNSLPPWQQGFCKALQTYGGYLTDTGQDGLYIAHIETQNAEHDAGMPDPLPIFQYLSAQNGSNGLACIGSPVTRCNMPFFNMPGLITGHHLHIIDPCVPKKMAGLPATCTGSALD